MFKTLHGNHPAPTTQILQLTFYCISFIIYLRLSVPLSIHQSIFFGGMHIRINCGHWYMSCGCPFTKDLHVKIQTISRLRIM